MTEKLIARLKPNQKLELIKGEEREVFFQILDANTDDLFDITGSDEIKVIMKGVSGLVTKTLTDDEEIDTDGGVEITEAVKGEFKVTLSEEDTEALLETQNGTIEIVIEEDDVRKIIHIERMLVVERRLL